MVKHMYKIILHIIMMIFSFQFTLFASGQNNIEHINDASFSPHGKVIGIASDSGFQILDWMNQQVTYRFPIQGGVKFLKWSPNGNRVLLVLWQDGEIPTYSMLDIEQNQILFSFQDEIRWFYTFAAGYSFYEDAYFVSVNEKIYPVSTELGHPNSLAFSPDGTEFAYITINGHIRFRNIDTGIILREFPFTEYQATSLGYTPEGDKMWIGLRFDTPIAFTDNNRLLYLDSISEEIIEVRELFYNIRNIGGGSEIFWIFDVKPDQKSALSVSALTFVSTTYLPNIYLHMVDLEQKETILNMASASISEIPTHRAFFSNSGTAYSLEDNGGGGWNIVIYGKDGYYRYVPSGKYTYRLVPVHPFAPDGSKFLMIEENRLYLVDITMPWYQQYQIIHFPITSIENYQLHEGL